MARGDIFQTIKTEGAILPADLLHRLATGGKDIDGLTTEAYHLAGTENLREAATRAWNRLQGAWEPFQAAMNKLPESETGTSLTRERWLLILFQELGYGRLTVHRAFEIEGKSYPISHLWQNTPIHLVTFRQDLDRRTPGARGAARVSPHSLVQEFLNRSDDHLWGFVANGLTLRILRDNVSLTRQAYVEFDLAAMMEGETYSDFFLLYVLCHQSRVEVPEGKTPEHCWLEKWYNTAAREGVRALDKLRRGVQDAINALGGGFLAHPTNADLRERLRNGDLTTLDYYRQVLRQVYRLLFLFVAEDRGLLLDPAAAAEAQALYTSHYSTQRLRALAGKRRGTRHPDLYRALRLVFTGLRTGCPDLALPALGSFLFSHDACPDVHDADIPNTALLAAVRHLAFTVDRNVLRPVNYRNLGSEELGSVYESLLEMHPEINIEAHAFKLDVAAGSERKTTGSYYTPSSLVNCLLDTALDPVLDEACKKPDTERAILDLKICDPACGSGHFLIAAAHRIAKRLAGARAREDEPAPHAVQHALRDVIGRCIYGVDINPMAVELCKINLWIEAIEPGKPLTFLEHHIQCGNSLLGTTPALMKGGVPNEAFKPIAGDVKAVCAALRKDNRLERKTKQRRLFAATASDQLGDLTSAFANLNFEDDSTPDAVAEKEEHYYELVKSAPYENARLLADAWCAAFVCEKVSATGFVVTEDSFRRWREDPHDMTPYEREMVIKLRDQYQFFHWHLVFPDAFRVPAEGETPSNEQTGWSGGFDVVLGNPPWERPKPEPAKFFASTRPDIANAQTSAIRAKLLTQLAADDPLLFARWKKHERTVMGGVAILTRTGQFPLTAVGKFNLGNALVERARSLIAPAGRVGMLNLSGLATDDSGKLFIQDVMKSRTLVSLYDFENRKGLFPGVHRMYKFSAVTLVGVGAPVGSADFLFFAETTADLSEVERHVRFSADDIALLNPLSGTCPIFRERREAELIKVLYRRADLKKPPEKVLFRWNAEPTFLFVMSDHSHLFNTREDMGLSAFDSSTICPVIEGIQHLPLYESKMIHQFDHRWSSLQSDGTQIKVVTSEKESPTCVAIPRYWIRSGDAAAKLDTISYDWTVVVREVTNASNERTTIAAITPQRPVGHNAQVFRFRSSAEEACCFLANLNSFALDSAARTKVGGSHLSSFILRQLPLLPSDMFRKRDCALGCSIRSRWFLHHTLELVFNAWDLEPFAWDCGYDGPPFVWDEERRFLIRCELDAAFFHLYLGTPDEWKEKGTKELLEYFPTARHAVDYAMETFPIVKRKDGAAHGHYRTKDTILHIYDEMAEAIRTGTPYQTHLDPPPGPPADAEGSFIPMDQWDNAIWQRYKNVIHPPKEERIAVAAEADIAAMAELAYPATEADHAICTAALAAIEQADELSSMDHLDVLLLATHPDWCKAFLATADQRKLDNAITRAPAAMLVGENDSIRWKDARDYLEQRHALAVDHVATGQPISTGSDLPAVKATLPGGAGKVVALALKALERVRKLRKDIDAAPQAQQPVLRILAKQHADNGIAA